MKIKEYNDVCALRTYRIVLSCMRWLMPSDATKEIGEMMYKEIDRLENIVDGMVITED